MVAQVTEPAGGTASELAVADSIAVQRLVRTTALAMTPVAVTESSRLQEIVCEVELYPSRQTSTGPEVVVARHVPSSTSNVACLQGSYRLQA